MSGDAAMSAVASSALARMRDLYVKNRFEMTPDALGIVLAEYYERYIRAPSLDPLMRLNGEEALPEWRAATIVDHFTNHRAEPQAKIEKRLEQLGSLADHLVDHGVYRAPVIVERPTAADVRVNEKSVRMLLSVVSAERALYQANVKTWYGYSDDFTLDAPARAFVRAKHNMVPLLRKRATFDAEPPPPP